jgi:hypothetical protein
MPIALTTPQLAKVKDHCRASAAPLARAVFVSPGRAVAAEVR